MNLLWYNNNTYTEGNNDISEEERNMITVQYPRAPLLGRIKTGTKSDKGYPKKLDHFMISNGSQKGIPQWDSYWEKKLGDKPRELPITVVSNSVQGEDNSIAFICRVRWAKKHKMCMMVEEGTAIAYKYDQKGTLTDKTEIECNPATCPFAQAKGDKKPECSVNATFHFVLRDPENKELFPIGGRHLFATASWIKIKSMIGSLSEIQRLTGSLALKPLTLRLREEVVSYTDSKGEHSSTIWVPYITLDITPEEARDVATTIKPVRIKRDEIEEQPEDYSSNDVQEEVIVPPEDDELDDTGIVDIPF